MLLDGSVENQGGRLKVAVHLDDARRHVTLWSKTFDGALQDVDTLQARIAGNVSDIAKVAASRDTAPIRDDPSLLATYLEGIDEESNGGGGRYLTIARDLVARAPRFAGGHLMLSAAVEDQSGHANLGLPADAQAQALAESVREAKTALALDPRNSGAYSELAQLTPLNAWRDREALLLKSLAIDPNNAGALSFYGIFLLDQVGRNREAAEQSRRALRAEPFAPWAMEELAENLARIGQADEAAAIMANARRLHPDYWELPISDLFVAAQSPPYSRALALLDDPAVRAQLAEYPAAGPQALALYRVGLTALASGDPAAKKAAALQIAAAVESGALGHLAAYGSLSALGDVDRAFQEADLGFTPAMLQQPSSPAGPSTAGLFGPPAAAMRRDPRFMQLAARLGLVDYWRASGHSPDFCAEPGLPYDCKAEAAKYAAAPTS